jgi:hypothetical protein
MYGSRSGRTLRIRHCQDAIAVNSSRAATITIALEKMKMYNYIIVSIALQLLRLHASTRRIGVIPWWLLARAWLQHDDDPWWCALRSFSAPAASILQFGVGA